MIYETDNTFRFLAKVVGILGLSLFLQLLLLYSEYINKEQGTTNILSNACKY